MPRSKHRRSRSRRRRPAHASAALLPNPATLAEVTVRGARVAQTHGQRLAEATPERVVEVLFDGWRLVGSRVDPTGARGTTEVFVVHRPGCWVGFFLVTGPARQDGTPGGPVDYVALAHPNRGPEPWQVLTGTARVYRVLDALRTPVPGAGPVAAPTPVEFFEALAGRRAEAAAAGVPTGPLADLAAVLMHGEVPDPDGSVAAARTLAGLGGFGDLTDQHR